MAPAPSRAAFRRSPHLVCHWQGGEFTVENYATGARVRADPLACQILDAFDRWRPAEAAVVRLGGGGGRAAIRRAVALLARRGLLQRRGRANARDSALEGWGAWRPAAALLHLATRDVPYVAEVDRAGRRLRPPGEGRRPPPLKRYPRAAALALPRPREGMLPALLRARRTWRRFGRRPVALEELATLLGLTFGIQGWLRVRGVGRVPLKTSPSGGACHPLEAYVLARRVAGLPGGLYHYAPDRHRLERVSRRAPRPSRYLASQWWYDGAAALVLITAVFGRCQWRYGHARGYRAVLAEAGHFCQTFCLVATWLGLAPFSSMALADSRVERDLGLDGIREAVLYAAGVGTRPADRHAPAGAPRIARAR